MALQEGRCVNCGSILYLEPANTQGHCLYCDAVFDNSEAFERAKAPEDFSYPNLPQEAYEGPNLDPVQVRSKLDMKQLEQAAATAKARPASSQAQYQVQGGKVPDLSLSTATKVKLAVGFLLLALGFVLLMWPLTARRDRQQAAIAEAFVAQGHEELAMGENFLIRGLNNTRVAWVRAKDIPEVEAVEDYRAFCEARAKALGLSEDGMQKGVEMKISSPEGGWLIKEGTGGAFATVKSLALKKTDSTKALP